MAQPIIPLQPYIPQGEGYGSAFTLPDANRMSAAEVLYNEGQKRREEDLANRKAFQDNLLLLGKAGGKGLSNHRQQFAQQYQDILNWAQQQRLAGKNPYEPGTNESFELQRRMNDLSARGQLMGEAYDYAVKNKGLISGNPDKYDVQDWNNKFQALNDTGLNDINTATFEDLKAKFDPEKHLNETLQRFPMVKTEDPNFENTNVPGLVKVKTTEGRDVPGSLKALTANDDYKKWLITGAVKNNSPQILKTFEQLPEVQDAIKSFTKTSNGKASQADIDAFAQGLFQDKNFQYDQQGYQNNLINNLAQEHAGGALKPSTTYQTRERPGYGKEPTESKKPIWTPAAFSAADVTPELVVDYLVKKQGDVKNAQGSSAGDQFKSPEWQQQYLPRYMQSFQQKLGDGKSGYVSFSKPGTENKPLVLNGTSVTGGTFLRLGDKYYFVGGSQEMQPDKMMQLMTLMLDPTLKDDEKRRRAKEFGPEVVDLDDKSQATKIAAYAGYNTIPGLKQHISNQIGGGNKTETPAERAARIARGG